ncbi:hypothetical protein DEALK_17190 [Dehalogenimonas alkenigignens]|uniref:Uncharacterized protein n=1 Tax=Dehalogenimonas alkenigignens TaxID=1217799 RepID=A0A0W0GK09_9CHLR|nr:hypothetical protein [Dehalogenimonas alkenigignens]KTB48872.1 hypothetical protein DEALK_17190 [Dehalogenimonas alkenigignens]
MGELLFYIISIVKCIESPPLSQRYGLSISGGLRIDIIPNSGMSISQKCRVFSRSILNGTVLGNALRRLSSILAFVNGQEYTQFMQCPINLGRNPVAIWLTMNSMHLKELFLYPL